MNDMKKTKAQLVSELAALRQRVELLEALVTKRQQVEEQMRFQIDRDIADRKHAEEQLRESEEKHRDLVENLNDIIYAVDEDGKLTYVSPAVERFLGYRPSEVIGRSFRDFIHPQDVPRLSESFSSILAGHVMANDYRIFTASGEVRWMRTSSRPVLVGKRVTGVQGVLADITERVQASEALQHYSERLETLREIDQAILGAESPAAIMRAALDRIERLVPCSSAGVILFDWEDGRAHVLASRATGQTVMEPGMRFRLSALAHVEEYRDGRVRVVDDIETLPSQSRAEQTLLGRGVRSYILAPLLTRDELVGALVVGSDVPGQCSADHVETAKEVAGSLAIAIQQARLQDEVQTQTEQVETSLREKDALLKEIHHRVKNNLQVISSLLNLQSEKISDEQMLAIFADSRDRVQSMALVHETLYQSPDLARVDFAEYAHNLTTYLMRAYGTNARRVSLKTDIQNVVLGLDTAIPCGLIINELVSNAMKHAFPEGTGGEIKVGLKSDNSGFELMVRDSGVGLPADVDLEKPESLGLQLVSTLVGQMDGRIELARSGGTTFLITFTEHERQNRS